MIPVAAPAAQHGPDVPVDRLDGAEGDFLVAVGQDPVQMPRQQAAELLEGRQPLPPQGAEPGGQEAPGPALIGVGPQLGELVSEEVGLGQPPVEGKELAERLAVLPVQVGPAPEQQPALAADQRASFAPLAEELRSPGLVDRLAGMAEDVELVLW